MAKMLKSALGRLTRVVRPTTKKIKHDELYVQSLRNYAKIEYGNDWSYALNYMLDNNGKAPKMGVK